ncbi:MAG: hypothetical protein ABFD92_02110 [Planctomycetaceae bacterium]|nr:hypothetical protein [Planctomycetaceae bacterium]
MAIDPVIIVEMVARLATCARRSERGDVVSYYARLCGVTAATMRRAAANAGASFGYKQRADKGVVKDADRAAACEAVANIIIKSGGRMPAWVAIDRAIQIGVLGPEFGLKPHHVQRHMRMLKAGGVEAVEASGPKSSRVINWGAVGHVLQMDSTNCSQWFFTEPTGEIRYTRRGEVYRNKPAKTPPVIRYAAIDPPSGMFRVRYYQTAGESADITLQFLYFAMTPSALGDRLPMAGQPDVLVLDKGPGNKSSAVLNVCQALGIEHRTHAAGHSWAKGHVEGLMRLWEQFFESELMLWPAKSLDELNERAELYNARFCQTRIFTRTKSTRTAHYAANRTAIVLPPAWDVFVEMATSTRETRSVAGGHLISYEGHEYYVGTLQGLATGDSVEVAKAVLEWDEQTRPVRIYHDGQMIIERAQVKDASGVYADHRVYEKRSDAILEAAAQDRELRLAKPVPPLPQADIESIKPMPVAAGHRPAVMRPAQPVRMYARTDALLKLSDKIGRELTRFDVHGLGWGESVSAAQIAAAVADLSRGADKGEGRNVAAG